MLFNDALPPIAGNRYCLRGMRAVLTATASMVLAGCMTLPTPAERRYAADTLAMQKEWLPETLDTGDFLLRTYRPAHIRPGPVLTIYIEGDGLAWISSDQMSDDPTPVNPIALRLALVHPQGNAAYLARPCQYTGASRRACSSRYWGQARFAPDVVSSTGLAIDMLKVEFGASQLILTGYSGGATLAALLAATRNDVVRLITVAGNLDPDAWARYHRITPLTGSLNPVALRRQLARVPQTHYVGGDDRNITPDLAHQWPVEIAGPNGANLKIIPGFDHGCCWPEQWPALTTRQGR
jgi:dienelactone hydrolase